MSCSCNGHRKRCLFASPASKCRPPPPQGDLVSDAHEQQPREGFRGEEDCGPRWPERALSSMQSKMQQRLYPSAVSSPHEDSMLGHGVYLGPLAAKTSLPSSTYGMYHRLRRLVNPSTWQQFQQESSPCHQSDIDVLVASCNSCDKVFRA